MEVGLRFGLQVVLSLLHHHCFYEMAPRKPLSSSRKSTATPLRKSARAKTAEVELGQVGTTRHGRTKAGQPTPVRRSARALTADIEPASVDTTRQGPKEDDLALTTGEGASTCTSKRGRTEDNLHNGKGGKKARRVSASYLFLYLQK